MQTFVQGAVLLYSKKVGEGMNRRCKKKYYKRYIDDVLGEVSESRYFRETLRQREAYTSLEIRHADLTKEIATFCQRYNLHFCVYRTEFSCDGDLTCLFVVFPAEPRLHGLYRVSYNDLAL